MDPPSYGRGPNGEVWKLEDAFHPLVRLTADLLSDDPLFVLLNSYTTGFAPGVLSNLIDLEITSKYGGQAESDEVGLPVRDKTAMLPCGSSGRWTKR